MQLIESIPLYTLSGQRTIELYRGHTDALHADAGVDVLIVSAYPSDYLPTERSLIGRLERRGISVATLARDKAEDLRMDFGCWLSHIVPGAPFRRILCFEPAIRGEPPEVVADLFRCLAALSAPTLPIRTVATGIVAAGDQGYPAELMLRRTVECAIEWMQGDLPLDRLLIAIRHDDRFDRLRRVFCDAAGDTLTRLSQQRAEASLEVDVLISAAVGESELVDIVTEVMHSVAPELRIFRAAHARPNIVGMAQQHYEALDTCGRVMALLSPDYIASRLCQDDLCIARFRSHSSDSPVLFPVYVRSAHLPPSVRVLRMIDCRERDLASLRAAAALLAIQLLGVRAYEDARAAPVEPHDETLLRAGELSQLLGVPVLGSARRRHHDVGVPGTVSKEAALVEFCVSAFTTLELRMFLRHLPGGKELVASLPNADNVSLLIYADKAVERLLERGMIDAGFFDQMRAQRPGRADDIAQLCRLW
ncbi:TIR domain-containing protein [Haliangium sp.]|uniref:TIR domain-containing protein n=1 Tax=Haliangium sp. TaxID=2663208 RepID=UPI003D0E82BB